MSGAKKFDSEKPNLHLVPPELDEYAAAGFTVGVPKYGKHNWEEGFDTWSRPYDALRRHLNDFWHRQDIDEESKIAHLKLATSSLAILVAHVERGIGQDDRPIGRGAPRDQYQVEDGTGDIHVFQRNRASDPYCQICDEDMSHPNHG